MFQKLRKRWQVSPFQLFLVLITFAVGGSLCGWLGRALLEMLPIGPGVLWMLLYVVLVTLLWPICVLIISVLTGQFPFFSRYLIRIFRRFSGKRPAPPVKLAIFASGAGSNAKKIIEFFNNQENRLIATIGLMVTNNPSAGAIEIAKKAGIPVLEISRERFFKGDGYLPEFKKMGIKYVILAGFLWKIPHTLISEFPGRILNIHPALLPKFGGRGMYGFMVHEAVLAAKDSHSGITIHEVDEQYDHGNYVFQAQCEVDAGETAESLANKIQQLEHKHYPLVIMTIFYRKRSIAVKIMRPYARLAHLLSSFDFLSV